MPTITLPDDLGSSSSSSGPVIGGVLFRRPATLSKSIEKEGATVTLPGGQIRTYRSSRGGRRRVYSISWPKLTESELAQLEAALAPPFVTFAPSSAEEAIVVSTEDALAIEAIAGTFPIRYAVSTTLKARDTFR